GGKFRFGSRARLQTFFRSTATDIPRSGKNCVAITEIGVAGYAAPLGFPTDSRNASPRRSVAATARQSGCAIWLGAIFHCIARRSRGYCSRSNPGNSVAGSVATRVDRNIAALTPKEETAGCAYNLSWNVILSEAENL